MRKIERGLLGVMLLLGLLLCTSPAEAESCPNEDVRTQQGVTRLPDCRAYELVTPPNTDGRLVVPPNTFYLSRAEEEFPTELASPFRDSFVFMTESSPLVEPAGANGTWDLYESIRSSTGWDTTRRLSLSGVETLSPPRPGGVSADHSYFFTDANESISYLGGPDGSFELVGLGSLNDEPYAQGRYISAGGAHIIFTTGHETGQSFWCSMVGEAKCKILKLEEDAPAEGTGAIYDRSADGATTVVSLLPGDKTPEAGEQAFYKGVSKDGSTVAFVIEGALYVRVPDEEDGETLKVGDGVTFAGLSDDGHYLFYVVGGADGTIHRFDTATEADVEINPTGIGKIVNISADGSHVYFISEAQLDGAQGTSGQPNLYVWRGGSPEYIATVVPSDEVRTSGEAPRSPELQPALTNWTEWVANPHPQVSGPGADSSRTTPDGSVIVFESRAKLTSYDNAGHTEIYRYEDGKGLTCLSCNLGKAAKSDSRLQDLILTPQWIVLHNLSSDGARVFFETSEALVGEDLDETNDIYEWEEEGGGSKIGLISSGRSREYLPPAPAAELPNVPYPNRLLSITPSGGDVMFLSQEALVSAGPTGGTPAIYDAREGGGFLEPTPPAYCVEEACRQASGSEPSISNGIRSAKISGNGNVKHRKHRCHRRSKKHRHCSRHRGGKSKRVRRASASVVSPDGGQPAIATVDANGAASEQQAEPAGASVPAATTSIGGSIEALALESVAAEESTTVAGGHPDFTTRFSLNHHLNAQGKPESDTRTEEVSVSIPPGLLGNPNSVPRCEMGEFVSYGNCSPDAQVGIAKLAVENFGRMTEAIYNLAPPHPEQEVARFGFIAGLYPVTLEISVHTAGDYGVTATVHGSPGLASLIEGKTTFWANPADESHDAQRLTPYETGVCVPAVPCKVGGKRKSGIPPADRKAFMTNPSACQSQEVGFRVSSYQYPGQPVSAIAPMAPITDCSGLPFAPTVVADPTSHVAGAPTGLNAKLVLPQHLGVDERATATMREARVTLPAGMQIAAGAANWIGTCSDQQVGFHEEVDTACPDASKLGTATIVSPDLPNPIEGEIYQRAPSPGHPFGLWLTSDALGLHIKLPGELEPDATTGRLTAVFRDLPEVPVEEIDLNVWGGARAPLQNPDACGTYAVDFAFAPHSQDPTATGQSQVQIDQGCGQGFNPGLEAGVTDPVAGKFSPLIVDLARREGEQGLRGFTLTLPDGELAKLKGVPLCSDAAASSGSCPADSKIGHALAATGPGPDPLWVPQPGKPEPSVYLAGPYKGSPFSVVTVVSAQAGPFDLGDLVVRSGLGLDPDTNRAVIKADPLPQFFEGVGLTYRRLHVVIDRPGFSLNPTDCRPMSVNSTFTSTQGSLAHPSAPFQVKGCKRLKFEPKLTLKLNGGTDRTDYPALTAVLKARKGDTNIGTTAVALPHSEFLAQEHIGTICTRKQFAADKCPKGSVYGKAKAWTPLLAKPLDGPVYLRSSNHPLPDLVVALGGELDVNLAARIDSDKHGGIRTTFESVPDAPVTKFVLKMRGGAKSLLVNSTDICAGAHRATVRMQAQNGRRLNLRPRLISRGCGKKKLGKHHRHR